MCPTGRNRSVGVSAKTRASPGGEEGIVYSPPVDNAVLNSPHSQHHVESPGHLRPIPLSPGVLLLLVVYRSRPSSQCLTAAVGSVLVRPIAGAMVELDGAAISP